MCNKCVEFDKKIEHLQTLATRDILETQMTRNEIAELVRELRDERAKAAPG